MRPFEDAAAALRLSKMAIAPKLFHDTSTGVKRGNSFINVNANEPLKLSLGSSGIMDDPVKRIPSFIDLKQSRGSDPETTSQRFGGAHMLPGFNDFGNSGGPEERNAPLHFEGGNRNDATAVRQAILQGRERPLLRQFSSIAPNNGLLMDSDMLGK